MLVFFINLDGQLRDMRFDTTKAMYAANEEWLTFACEVPEGMVQLDLTHQSDMYWYSLSTLGNLVMRSGMGVHLVTSQLMEQQAKVMKKKVDDLMKSDPEKGMTMMKRMK